MEENYKVLHDMASKILIGSKKDFINDFVDKYNTMINPTY